MGLTRKQVVHSIPLYVTYGLGTAVCWLYAPWAALLYVGVCAFGNLWFIVTICPHCGAYNRGCPSGYNLCAQRLVKKGSPKRFKEAFKRNVWAVALSWFVPLVFGALILWPSFPTVPLVPLALLVVFCVMAFGVLPFGMRKEGCSRCPNRKNCPYCAE